MKRRIKILLSLIYFSNLAIAQNCTIPIQRIQSIPNNQTEGIQTTDITISKNRITFEISNHDTISHCVYSYNGNIDCSIEMLMPTGDWIKHDPIITCGTGYYYAQLPPKSKATASYHIEYVKGDSLVTLRLVTYVSDTKIQTEAFSHHIDPINFLPTEVRMIKYYERLLKHSKVNSNKRLNALLILAYQTKDRKKKLELLKIAATEYPNSDKASYNYISQLLTYIKKENYSKSEKYVIISYAINNFNTLQSSKTYRDKSKRWSTILTDGLLSKTEWLNMNTLPYSITDLEYYCELPELLDESIKILFK